MSERTERIHVGALARVEGEGALHVRVRDGRVEDVRLEIFEPPRFFEALLRGRSYLEPVDITSRICGICPVAYQMSAALAMEDACGVRVGGPIRELRRLIYWGEWIESHALHIYLLHAPDFLGCDSAVEMARDHPDLVRSGLQLKKVGNAILELIGGRPVHPVNLCVGGFYRAPTRSELRTLVAPLEQARETALATVRWAASLDFSDLRIDAELVSLAAGDGYPLLDGRIRSTDGLDLPVSAFSQAFTEEQSAHSTALWSSHLGRAYLVGPLARFALGRAHLSTEVRAEARAAGLDGGCRNPFQSIVVRALETLEACTRALQIVEAYEEPDPPRLEVQPRAGIGHGASEAPRGLLYHRYRIDAEGRIEEAVIVPPTSQNQRVIAGDVRRVVESGLDLPREQLAWRCEQAIRNHDPCISCATHYLRLEVEG